MDERLAVVLSLKADGMGESDFRMSSVNTYEMSFETFALLENALLDMFKGLNAASVDLRKKDKA